MSDIKLLIDEYVLENRGLRFQIERLLVLVRTLTFMYQEKGEVQLTDEIRTQADRFSLEIEQLETSVVLKVKEKQEE